MKNDTVISVKGISKKYTITVGYQADTLRERLVELARSPFKLFGNATHTKKKIFWALKDINFEVKRGEVVGILGKNGAGKSTLLKILARITEPTTGEIKFQGRVASLLEVGTGFNPELTGRENIFLNGAIIGMTRKEIAQKFDDIVEFSGVREFLDVPVKRYSSGMYVRLAFAVAAHLDADIMLVDEVLAVGDIEFQEKCLNKMSSLSHSGRTVIFVSHNMAAVKHLCTRAIYLVNGAISAHGSVNQVIQKYVNQVKSSNRQQLPSNEVVNNASITVHTQKDGSMTFRITFTSTKSVKSYVAIGINNADGRLVTLHSKFYKQKMHISKGKNTIICNVKALWFKDETYTCSLFLGDSFESYFLSDQIYQIKIKNKNHYPTYIYPDESQGPIMCEQRWEKI